MSLFNFFKSEPAATTEPAPTPVPPTDTAFVPPAANPMDQFVDIFKASDSANLTSISDPLFDINEDALRSSIANMPVLDSPEIRQLKESAKTNPEAMEQLLDAVAKNSLLHSMKSATTIAERAAQIMAERIQKQIPASLTTLQSQQALEVNPVFSNPAIKPVVDAIRANIQDKMPNATPAQIAQKTQEYLTGLSQLVAPAPEPKSTLTGGTRSNINISDFFK